MSCGEIGVKYGFKFFGLSNCNKWNCFLLKWIGCRWSRFEGVRNILGILIWMGLVKGVKEIFKGRWLSR